MILQPTAEPLRKVPHKAEWKSASWPREDPGGRHCRRNYRGGRRQLARHIGCFR